MTVSANMTQCARWGEPCEPHDLVCNRCSETRVRAALPASDVSPDEQSDATLDERLTRIEELAGEKAYRLTLTIDGALGGESTVVVAVLTAPDGPATPPEDVWAEPAVVATFECGTSDVVAARVQMVTRLSADRGLHAPEVRRRLRVGTRGFMGDAAAAGMLLDARSHMARLALDPRRAGAARVEEAGGTLAVLVEFSDDEASAGEQPAPATVVEIFSEAAPTSALRESVAAWVASSKKVDSTRNF
jgi:hypothetical protein